MTDLLQSARLFEVSTRIQSTSTWLFEFAEGKKLDAQGKSSFKWAGRFLTKVDWTSGITTETSIEGGLAFSATNTRPKFYASLVKTAPDFQAIGIDSEKKLNLFLSGLYRVLIAEGEDSTSLDENHLKIASKFLHVLSESIIVELSNNGLPRQQTFSSVGVFS